MTKLKRIIGLFLLLQLLFTLAAADEHYYGPWITDREATCTLEGHQIKYCKHCDHWEQRYTKKLPHTVDQWVVSKEPTCTEDGVRNATCTVCNSYLRVKIDKLGHDWQPSNIVVAPTCDSPGKGDMTCARCGKVKKDTSIPRLKHEWGDWTIIEEPKGKTKGLRERTCSLCGKVDKDRFYYEGTLYEGMPSDPVVCMVQVMLRDLGYYDGPISSGAFGERTGQGVAAFQKNNGLPSNAVADPATVIEIRKQWEARTGRDMYSITKEDYTVK